MLNLIVPDRFASEVTQHLFLNYIECPGYPLILGIFGRPGDGKTYQLRSLLGEALVGQYSVSAADLESDRAGQPGKLVLAEYISAARLIESGKPAALIIDDVDTTVGEWAQNTGTVNHQQVLAQLMHLADRPTSIERIGDVRRVPVFVTGNDPGKLYAPLRRPGRMHVMHWQPTHDELGHITSSIFEEMLTPEQVMSLVRRHAHQPIAFFAQLRTEILRHVASSIIKRSAMEMSAIISDPQKYNLLLNAAAASSSGEIYAITCEEAAKLEMTIRSGQQSYLHSEPVIKNRSSSKALRGLRT